MNTYFGINGYSLEPWHCTVNVTSLVLPHQLSRGGRTAKILGADAEMQGVGSGCTLAIIGLVWIGGLSKNHRMTSPNRGSLSPMVIFMKMRTTSRMCQTPRKALLSENRELGELMQQEIR